MNKTFSSLAWYGNSIFLFVSDEQDGDDLNNNKPTNTIWKHVTEMDFNRKEFQKYEIFFSFVCQLVVGTKFIRYASAKMHQKRLMAFQMPE